MSLKVNGKGYDWGDVDFNIPGLYLEPQSIDYSDELEKELLYGIGRKPRGYGEGNYKADAKISLLRDDFDELLDYARRQGKSLYNLKFAKIGVSYANDGGKTRTDILSTVTITKIAHKGSQGDKSLSVDIDLMVVGGVTRDGVRAV